MEKCPSFMRNSKLSSQESLFMYWSLSLFTLRDPIGMISAFDDLIYLKIYRQRGKGAPTPRGHLNSRLMTGLARIQVEIFVLFQDYFSYSEQHYERVLGGTGGGLNVRWVKANKLSQGLLPKKVALFF